MTQQIQQELNEINENRWNTAINMLRMIRDSLARLEERLDTVDSRIQALENTNEEIPRNFSVGYIVEPEGIHPPLEQTYSFPLASTCLIPSQTVEDVKVTVKLDEKPIEPFLKEKTKFDSLRIEDNDS